MTSDGGGSSHGASQPDGQEPSLAQLRRELDDAHILLAGIQGSTTFRAAAKASRLAHRLVPPGSRRRQVVRRLLGRRGPGAGTAPASVLESGPSNLQRLTSRAAPDAQAFTVVVWSRPGGDLRRTLTSLRAQTWSRWQAALTEPAGAEPPARPPMASTRSRRPPGAPPSSPSSPGTTRSPRGPAPPAYGSVPRGRRRPCSPPTTWTEPLPCAHRAPGRQSRPAPGLWRR